MTQKAMRIEGAGEYGPPPYRAGIRTEADIERRAEFAHRILTLYEEEHSDEFGDGEDMGVEHATVSLLADLIHYYGADTLVFDEMLKRARGHATRERNRAKE